MNKNIVSFVINNDTLNKIKTFYADKIVSNPNEYIIFMAKDKNCVVTVYYTLTVVFQGKEALNNAMIFGYKDNKEWLYNCTHAGSDEVGTGDYFGPIVVVATYVKKEQIDDLNKLGVADSKKINDQYILDIGPKLIKDYPHSILVLDNSKYNELIRSGYNMNSIKAAMHNKAYLNLLKKNHDIPLFVMDQFTPKDNYYKYIEGEKEIVKNVDFITKGESASIAVALSSMIARYTFLNKMREMSKELKEEVPLGAGDGVDNFIKKIIQSKGEDYLYKIAKVNFKNTSKVKESLQEKLV